MKRPTDEEIEDMRNAAQAATNGASKYPGMSYEEGLRDALEWVMGEYDGKLEI